MAIDYEKYIEYRVSSACVEDEIEGRKAIKKAENISKKMEANLQISMFASDSLNSIPKLMEEAGYSEDCIKATKKHHSKKMLEEMGVVIINPATNKPAE